MKKTLTITIFLLGFSNLVFAQLYEKNLAEIGVGFGVLNRFDSNYEQGRSDESQFVFQLEGVYAQRYGILIGNYSVSIEHDTYWNKAHFSNTGGIGVSLFHGKPIRLDVLIHAGGDYASGTDIINVRPTFGASTSIYFDSLRITCKTRGALGWFEGYSETGITIGYYLRTQKYDWQKLSRTFSNKGLGI
jgi:hypothetical protein